ncbi:MAG: phosphatase PAP2 family protein [Gemmatimonadaceae bacterium]
MSSLSLPSASANQSAFPTTLASVGWQAQARLLVTADSVSPIVAARVYAMLGVAQYGAVVDADARVDRLGILKEQGVGNGDGGRRRSEARRGAVAAASARILSALFPRAAVVAAIEQRFRDEQAASPPGLESYFAIGVPVGRAFGDVMIAWKANDRFTDAWTGTLPTGAGFWTRNPAPVGGTLPALAGPQFGAMKPYFLTGGNQFHSAEPPAFRSAAFFTALAEVSAFSATRTPAQLESAVAWNLNVGSVTALGRWDEFASGFIAENHYDELAAAHVFALTNAAAMDAVIACWESKFSYSYIRPYQVDQVNYPITTPLGKPNHPSYPSGHSCVSSAAAAVIEAFFPEHAGWLEQQVIDAGNSRIYGGLHYRFDVVAGQSLGRAVAGEALKYDRQQGLLDAVR